MLTKEYDVSMTLKKIGLYQPFDEEKSLSIILSRKTIYYFLLKKVYSGLYILHPFHSLATKNFHVKFLKTIPVLKHLDSKPIISNDSYSPNLNQEVEEQVQHVIQLALN